MSLTNLHSTKDLFRIWFTWKNKAIASFFIVVTVVMLFAYIYPPVYVSHAKIMILPRTSEGVVISTGKSEEHRISPVSLADINTEIELLTSDSVMRNTVRSFMKGGGVGLKAKDHAWYKRALDYVNKEFRKVLLFLRLKNKMSFFDYNVQLLVDSLEIEPIAMSNVISVSLDAEMPKAAQVVLNRVLNNYIQHHNKVYTKEKGIQFYERQADSYLKRLTEAERKLREYQSKWNITDLSIQKDTNIKRMGDLNAQLTDIDLSDDQTKLKQRMVIEKALKKLQADTNELSRKESIIKDLARNIELLQNNYMLYAAKTEDAKIYQKRVGRALANISIVDGATFPVAVDFPKRTLLLLISIVVGFFVAMGLPFLLEYMDHSPKSEDDINSLLSLPVISSIPEKRD